MSRTSVVVVGGGVIGLACAWELTRRGAEVPVLERDAVGSEVSRGDTGWVVPSMTSPLPAPGMVREGVCQLVTRNDAFVLRPSLTPAFVRWLWRFWRSASPARFGAGARTLLALSRRTLELFDAYREAGIRFEMYATGLLIAARTRAGLRKYDEVFRRLRALPGHDDLFVASGHGMLGVTLAPATAAFLAPLVLEGRMAPELEPFDPGRR